MWESQLRLIILLLTAGRLLKQAAAADVFYDECDHSIIADLNKVRGPPERLQIILDRNKLPGTSVSTFISLLLYILYST